jgi:23S rRNA pseudouridine2605 synthase
MKQWHQQGEALLTIENLRGWINAAGLALFAPRPQIASPAPSLVEAVLGAPNPNPTLEQTSEARSLLARLVAEGLAVPLNLLGPGVGTVHAGAPGDTPDFVASTAVFSYVFTLRGDKAWKQPPATSGAFKVSQLALATHEALSRRGPLSAYDLTTEVGKEVTEAAVLRALGELWTHLRVLPLAQPDGASALWELTSARFTKQIKAGANAGQPSALSALISLYLGQAVVAAEDEIESFLSPLASRSRIRDVIHALLSARQLDTIAVEGRTMLHVAGALPAFLAPEAAVAVPESQAAGDGEIAVETDGTQDVDAIDEAPTRITKFVPKPRKIGTGYLAKAKPAKFAGRPFGLTKPVASGFDSK